MNASIEMKKMILNAGGKMLNERKKARELLDKGGKKSAEMIKKIKEVPEGLWFMGSRALPLAIGQILVGGAKIGWKGVDKYLLDENWRKGIGAGLKATEQWAKG